ncbi:hypothetical protein N7457_004701 [Penicillium paradoxum]|uniref:uncharacterized protein n=1 Tax=Penicillium paradoxum TaxID=176176 RepID=UPI002546A663|nr:uncharacterized protein N7457_004701 [Penicillium paradoxum]KAJ5782927.1 hypothetical protein N7457_004701 [Penicillium paradoxum]
MGFRIYRSHNEGITLTIIIGRSARPGRRTKSILSENPRNRPTGKPVRPSRPTKSPVSKPKHQANPTHTNKKIARPLFAANDAGFAQFLKNHTSPKHQRVTAGGRIVPMEPASPPRLNGPLPGSREAMDDDEVLVQSGYHDDGIVVGHPTRDMRENALTMRSSIEFGDACPEQLPPAILFGTPQTQEEAQERAFAFAELMRLDPTESEWTVQQPFRESEPESDSQSPNRAEGGFPDEITVDIFDTEALVVRWTLFARIIAHDDTSINMMMALVDRPGLFPNIDYYRRFVKCAWLAGTILAAEAEWQLQSKLLAHERYLREVNEFIALNPQATPGDWSYDLRVWNTTERARVLNALDELELLRQSVVTPIVNTPTINPSPRSLQSPVRHETNENGSSGNETSVTGSTETDRANIHRGVPIIDPHTGHPIEFQRQILTATNNARSRDVFRNSGLLHQNDQTADNMPAGGDVSLFDATSPRATQPSVEETHSEPTDNDTTSWIPQETWTQPGPRDRGLISNTVPRNFGRNGQNTRSPLRSITEIDQEGLSVESASTVATDGARTPSTNRSNEDEPYNTSEDNLPQIEQQIVQNESLDELVGNPNDEQQSSKRSFTASLESETHAITESNEPEIDQHILHSESIGEPVWGGLDERQDMTRRLRLSSLEYGSDLLEYGIASESGPVRSPEEIASQVGQDFNPSAFANFPGLDGSNEERQRTGDRSFAVFEFGDYQGDSIDMLQVDVQDNRQQEESVEQKGGSLAESSQEDTGRSPETLRSTSITLTMDGSRKDGPYRTIDAPLLSRNSPARAVSRSNSRNRHDAPVGSLSANGSPMISSSLQARWRRDARINIRNARRSRKNSWRLDSASSDEMPATIARTILGFDAPDSQQNTRFSPVYLQFIHVDAQHTAPAIVNTSKIHAHAEHR